MQELAHCSIYTRTHVHVHGHAKNSGMKLRLICSIKIVLLHVKIMCSHVSLHLFKQIEDVCRDNIGLGGLHVIAYGDFYQLPPVPDMGHGDAGDYALTSKFRQLMHHCNITTVKRQNCPDFMQCMHHCNISTVKRQSCGDFINAIREVSNGNMSALLYALVDLFLANVCQYMLTILLRRHLDCVYTSGVNISQSCQCDIWKTTVVEQKENI